MSVIAAEAKKGPKGNHNEARVLESSESPTSLEATGIRAVGMPSWPTDSNEDCRKPWDFMEYYMCSQFPSAKHSKTSRNYLLATNHCCNMHSSDLQGENARFPWTEPLVWHTLVIHSAETMLTTHLAPSLVLRTHSLTHTHKPCHGGILTRATENKGGKKDRFWCSFFSLTPPSALCGSWLYVHFENSKGKEVLFDPFWQGA